MTSLGHFVEGVIGQAKKAKDSVVTTTGAGGVKPIVALEGQISLVKLKEILFFSVDRLISQAAIHLVDQSALEISDGVGKFGRMLKERGAGLVIQAEIGASTMMYAENAPIQSLYTVQASLRKLPFEEGYFDFVLGNFATPYQGDMTRAIREMARMMSVGGNGIFVDFHPFGLYAKRGAQRIKGMGVSIRGFEDYFRICKHNGLVINDIKEAFVDDTVRPLFTTDEEKSVYRRVKDSPLLLCASVRKV